jgi:ectoine hydroxylase-related dioxygenase (phytanoyl-CoA dioxygenase family)
MTNEQIKELQVKGFTIVRNQIEAKSLDTLSDMCDEAFIMHRNTQKANGNDIATGGVALNVPIGNTGFLSVLEYFQKIGIIKSLEEKFFNSKCILNSFSALDNLPNQPNFSAVPHRDLRFYSGMFPMMVNCLVMIDDFTVENGATYLYPESHRVEGKPTDEEFFKGAIQVTGKRGDIIIFNSNTWHCSAPNTTKGHRRALPITLSRSFMKQLLDYPRAIGYRKQNCFSEEMQQLLGYHSRVPANLDEWYQPEHNRFYKKNQD